MRDDRAFPRLGAANYWTVMQNEPTDPPKPQKALINDLLKRSFNYRASEDLSPELLKLVGRLREQEDGDA